MKEGFYIEGAEQLIANLDTLGQRCAKTVIRQAVRKGRSVMLRQAVANARALPRSEKRLFVAGKKGQEDIRMSELIARNIVLSVPRRQVPGSYSMHVQMRRNVPEFVHVSKAGTQTYIPAAIEYGHGSSPQDAARPYLRPAADMTLAETKRVLAEQLRVGILREAIKYRYSQPPIGPAITIPTVSGRAVA